MPWFSVVGWTIYFIQTRELAIAVRPKFATAEASAWVGRQVSRSHGDNEKIRSLGVGLISIVLQAGDAWCQRSKLSRLPHLCSTESAGGFPERV